MNKKVEIKKLLPEAQLEYQARMSNFRTASKRLRELRENYYGNGKKITQEKLPEELEKKCGFDISDRSLRSYESNEALEYPKEVLKMSAETLYNLAKLYGVSTDYILGLTDIKSPDLEIRDICKKTGLCEDFIREICYEFEDRDKYPTHTIDLFNLLSNISDGFRIFDDIYRYFKSDKMEYWVGDESYSHFDDFSHIEDYCLPFKQLIAVEILENIATSRADTINKDILEGIFLKIIEKSLILIKSTINNE